jgi:hypothetical protein
MELPEWATSAHCAPTSRLCRASALSRTSAAEMLQSQAAAPQSAPLATGELA